MTSVPSLTPWLEVSREGMPVVWRSPRWTRARPIGGAAGGDSVLVTSTALLISCRRVQPITKEWKGVEDGRRVSASGGSTTGGTGWGRLLELEGTVRPRSRREHTHRERVKATWTEAGSERSGGRRKQGEYSEP